MTLGRLHQMREVILQRKRDDREDDMVIQETGLRAIMSTIMASVGSKKGAKEAARFKLFERRRVKKLASYEQIVGMFGGGDDG